MRQLRNVQDLTRCSGALFENWVITEFLKRRWNAGRQSNLFFLRSHGDLEVDRVLKQRQVLGPVEIKSGATVSSDWLWRCAAGANWLGHTALVAGTRCLRRHREVSTPWVVAAKGAANTSRLINCGQIGLDQAHP